MVSLFSCTEKKNHKFYLRFHYVGMKNGKNFWLYLAYLPLPSEKKKKPKHLYLIE